MVLPQRSLGSAREVLTLAGRDFLASWKILAVTSLAYRLIAFALLTPAVGLLIRWIRSGTQSRVVADVDILRFFVTTRAGVATLVIGGSLIAAITALEVACLVAVAMAARHGVTVTARKALAFGAARSADVLRLTAHMVARVLAGAPVLLAIAGLVYWWLLRRYDINYYLSQRPFEYWLAVALVGLVVLATVVVVVHRLALWTIALPLVLFERVHPRKALGESKRRSAGHERVVLACLAAWSLGGLALPLAARALLDGLGRSLAPAFAGSITLLVTFVAVLVALWVVIGIAVSVITVSFFSLILVRLYARRAAAGAGESSARAIEGQPLRLSGRMTLAIGALLLLACAGVALLAFLHTRRNEPVLVIAHRGSSAAAPENTLAAFRVAADQQADFIELDVQETRDGQIVVVHDSDLMKLAGVPGKIWDGDAAQLRTIDIGSHTGPQFAGERVPTLTEVLQAMKGRCRVVVELKSYGHNRRLEQGVVEIVEAAAMENECIFMSLDHSMMRELKRLRPSWRCGLLVAKSMGDLTTLGADFLAVEARMATARFVRRAHRAGQDVYVWTVNDPAWMLAALSRGVDGLITDRPDLARRVVARREALSDSQRLLVALLVRLGATTQALESEDALRP